MSFPFLLILLLEVILRITTGYPTGFYRGEHMATWRDGVMVYRPGEKITIFPGLFGGYHVMANNYGFRPTSPGQVVEEDKKGRTRILTVGDSWTDCFNVDDEFTYPAYLQKQLDARQKGRYEVLNTAFGGGSIQKHLNRLKAFLHLKPNAVVLGFCPNDLGQDLLWEHWAIDPLKTNPLKLRRGKMVWLLSVFDGHTAIGEWCLRRKADRAIAGKMRQYNRPISNEEKLAIYQQNLKILQPLVNAPHLNDYYLERFKIYFGILDEIKFICDRAGAKLIVWTSPEFDEVYDPSYHRPHVKALRAYCEAHDIVFVDPQPAFRHAIEADPAINLYEWAPADYHPTRHGYQLIAQSIAKAL